MPDNNTITAIPGITVGHSTNSEAATGCTVVLCEGGATPGVFVPGGAPGTREIALLSPEQTVEQIHGILLAGGSAFGLDATAGVMSYLESKNIGFQTSAATIPVVPAAIIYDLAIGDSSIRPTPQMATEACETSSGEPVSQGSVGVGTGATVGKLRGMEHAMKGGIGSALIAGGNGERVGALVVVNAMGDVRDPETNTILAGARDDEGKIIDSAKFLRTGKMESPFTEAARPTVHP